MWLVLAFYTLLFSRLLLLPLTWRKLRPFTENRYAVVIVAATSFSYSYLIAALLARRMMLGPDYSERLFLTVQAHTAFDFGLFVFAILRKSSARKLLACSSLVVSVAWLFVWAINTAV